MVNQSKLKTEAHFNYPKESISTTIVQVASKLFCKPNQKHETPRSKFYSNS